MPGHQQNSRQLLKSKKSKNLIPVKGKFEIEFFIVSDENLEQLKEYSNGSTKFDIALFLFALAIALITTLLTTVINSRLIFAILISVASLSFVTGMFNYIGYCKSRKRIIDILKRIKRNKCDTA
jgi:hypothetical protein